MNFIQNMPSARIEFLPISEKKSITGDKKNILRKKKNFFQIDETFFYFVALNNYSRKLSNAFFVSSPLLTFSKIDLIFFFS